MRLHALGLAAAVCWACAHRACQRALPLRGGPDEQPSVPHEQHPLSPPRGCIIAELFLALSEGGRRPKRGALFPGDRLNVTRGQSCWISLGMRIEAVASRRASRGYLASSATPLEHPIHRALGPFDRSALRGLRTLGPQEPTPSRGAMPFRQMACQDVVFRASWHITWRLSVKLPWCNTTGLLLRFPRHAGIGGVRFKEGPGVLEKC